MAFQVKHVKVENKNKKKQKQKQKQDRFLYVGIVDRKTKMELETLPPPSLTTLANYSR